MKLQIYSNFNFKFDYEFDNPVTIWIDNFSNIDTNIEGLKIFVALEPNEISNLNRTIKENSLKFDYILTYDEKLLNELSNSILLEHGTKWMLESEYLNTNTEYDVCNNLTIEDYINNKHSIMKNYENALKWIHYDKRLFDEINILINENNYKECLAY
jgi:hypothetical protein